MRSLSLLVPIMLATALPTLAPSTSAQQNNRLAPFGSIRTDLELRPEHGGWSLKYCPDNTCERFSCSGSECNAGLLDFSFLYLSHISGYTYLSEFKKKEAPHVTPGVLERYRASCPQSSERHAVVCVLRTLYKTDRVRIWFVRYDEGQRNQEAVDLERELQRSAQP